MQKWERRRRKGKEKEKEGEGRGRTNEQGRQRKREKRGEEKAKGKSREWYNFIPSLVQDPSQPPKDLLKATVGKKKKIPNKD